MNSWRPSRFFGSPGEDEQDVPVATRLVQALYVVSRIVDSNVYAHFKNQLTLAPRKTPYPDTCNGLPHCARIEVLSWRDVLPHPCREDVVQWTRQPGPAQEWFLDGIKKHLQGLGFTVVSIQTTFASPYKEDPQSIDVVLRDEKFIKMFFQWDVDNATEPTSADRDRQEKEPNGSGVSN